MADNRRGSFSEAISRFTLSPNVEDRRGMPGDYSAIGQIEKLIGRPYSNPVLGLAHILRGFASDPMNITPGMDRVLLEESQRAASQTPLSARSRQTTPISDQIVYDQNGEWLSIQPSNKSNPTPPVPAYETATPSGPRTRKF